MIQRQQSKELQHLVAFITLKDGSEVSIDRQSFLHPDSFADYALTICMAQGYCDNPDEIAAEVWRIEAEDKDTGELTLAPAIYPYHEEGED